MTLEAVLSFLLQAAGIGAIVSLLVNILKRVNLVKDGSGEVAVKILNLLAFVALWVLGNFFPDVDLWSIDAIAKSIADIGFLILSLMFPVANYAAAKVYPLVRGTPILGYSHSAY